MSSLTRQIRPPICLFCAFLKVSSDAISVDRRGIVAIVLNLNVKLGVNKRETGYGHIPIHCH
jgi:hypothetical protein